MITTIKGRMEQSVTLPPELSLLKKNIEQISSSRRTNGQTRLLNELKIIDEGSLNKINEVTQTRMTGPPDGKCSCCGN
jgi:hypothetical protein